jgi:hypothetical protein
VADETPEALPPFVKWPIFPFEGELRVRPIAEPLDGDLPRAGEPGGPPCGTCATDDDAYIWVDEHWRVRPYGEPVGVPVLVLLESREHVDLDGLGPDRAAELGQLIVRLDRAIQTVGGIGRVHVMRWGDGAQHLHFWFYARPRGAWQMAGLFMPMWAMIYPKTPADVWRANLVVVARALAAGGGRSVLR